MNGKEGNITVRTVHTLIFNSLWRRNMPRNKVSLSTSGENRVHSRMIDAPRKSILNGIHDFAEQHRLSLVADDNRG